MNRTQPTIGISNGRACGKGCQLLDSSDIEYAENINYKIDEALLILFSILEAMVTSELTYV